MIQFSEINDAEVDSLALFLATQGREGSAPEWHKIFALALKVNAPVWEVEEVLAAYDKSMHVVSQREWLKRGMVVMFAEAQAARMQMEKAQRLISPARLVS